MGTPEQGNITLRTTVYSGDAANRSPHVLPNVILSPGGFHQFNRILATAGFTQGYVRVERVVGTSPFYAYGVINDNFNSDGSFVFPLTAGSLDGDHGADLAGHCGNRTVHQRADGDELLGGSPRSSVSASWLTGSPPRTARPDLAWRSGPASSGSFPMSSTPNSDRRASKGVSSSRGGLAGALFVRGGERRHERGRDRGSDELLRWPWWSVRRFLQRGVLRGSLQRYSVWIEALQQNRENRTNLALVNTGEVDASPSVFQLDIYDGVDGAMLANTVTGLASCGQRLASDQRHPGEVRSSHHAGLCADQQDFRQQSLPGLRSDQ